MKYYSLLDNNDFVIDTRKFKEGEQPVNAVEALSVNNEYKPKYDRDNDIIIEGATDEYIFDNYSESFENRIKDIYTSLSIRALQSSMDKTGTYEYLQVQRTEYENKYKVCKGDLIDPYLEDAIVKEMDRDYTDQSLSDLLISLGVTPTGTKREQFSQLVIFKYEYSLDRLNRFMGFLTDFRTKCRTWIEQYEWSKLNQAFSLAESIPEQLDMTDAENIYNQFNNI
jgi:hypothetical protein